MKDNSILREHFERLKEMVPEIYNDHESTVGKASESVLYPLLTSALNLLETIYIQEPMSLRPEQISAYDRIVKTIQERGFSFQGNDELQSKAAELMIPSKKPMQKAKGKNQQNPGSHKHAM